jgi:putative sterol carrier protein/ferredoxin
MKCADACPVKAISRDLEPSYRTVGFSNNPGVKKWYNKLEPCAKYWAVKVDCSACIASCPYNKPNDLIHQIGLRVGQTPAKGLLRKLDDLLGYGRPFDKKIMFEWWESNRKKTTFAKIKDRISDKPQLITGEGEVDQTIAPEIKIPRDFFEYLPVKLSRNPERLAGMNAILQFNLSGENGGKWCISVHNKQVEVVEGAKSEAQCQFTLKDEDFVALVTGQLNPMGAMMSGRIKMSGDMAMAQKLKPILS